MSVGKWNSTFLSGGIANPAEYSAGRDKLIADGIIDECGGFIMWKNEPATAS